MVCENMANKLGCVDGGQVAAHCVFKLGQLDGDKVALQPSANLLNGRGALRREGRAVLGGGTELSGPENARCA